MSKHGIRRAVISVFDKTGLVEFAKALHDEFNIEILSTGGTARTLTEHGIPVTLVETVTGCGEMMDGRVKTLHPAIHGGILADRDNPDHMRQLADAGIQPVDMVVVNLYAFEKAVAEPGCSFEQAIEMIDIGGPCMLRASAKNHRHVLVCPSPDRYSQVLETLRSGDPESLKKARYEGAVAAFARTSQYDANIINWLESLELESASAPESCAIRLSEGTSLRYGENPHQAATCYRLQGDPRSGALSRLVGDSEKEISFNNYLDAAAALDLCNDLSQASAWEGQAVSVFIKHNNACGVGVSDDPVEAYRRAYLGDPNAAMGGILACSTPVDEAMADAVMNSLGLWGKDAGAAAFFAEVWLAPGFSEEAVERIRTLKPWGRNVRLLNTSDDPGRSSRNADYRQIPGGMLAQGADVAGLDEEQWKVVSKRKPTDQELDNLRLAWLVCKHTKSNAITICNDGLLLGNGAGQMSRVMSCRLATWLARENGHEARLPGSVAASDAFFPFRDGPDILADAGVSAIIQPGGSKRDEDTIAACNERGISMIFTGTRHFRH